MSFRVFPGICLLCRAASGRALELCADCEADLPRLREHCDICALPLPAANAICGDCLTKPPAFSLTLVPFRYEPPMDHLILRFKHGGDLAGGRVLGHMLADHVCDNLGQPPAVIAPVPLHWRRAGRRGFNQALELAVQLSATLDVPCVPRLLQRIKPTAAQQVLNRAARRRNLRDAFVVRGDVRGLRVAIVDDVVTTGSTADSLATTLRNAGAADVQLWAVARTPLAK